MASVQVGKLKPMKIEREYVELWTLEGIRKVHHEKTKDEVFWSRGAFQESLIKTKKMRKAVMTRFS